MDEQQQGPPAAAGEVKGLVRLRCQAELMSDGTIRSGAVIESNIEPLLFEHVARLVQHARRTTMIEGVKAANQAAVPADAFNALLAADLGLLDAVKEAMAEAPIIQKASAIPGMPRPLNGRRFKLE